MSASMTLIRSVPKYLLLTTFAALLATACGPRSILGPEDDAGADVAVDVVQPTDMGADVHDAGVDVGFDVRPDVQMPDVMDVVFVDATDAMDAHDVTDVTDVYDVTDVTDVHDVTDVTDAMDVHDVTDVTDAHDVTDVMDVAMDAGPMGPGILGSAAQFTILGGSTVSSTGLSTIVGEVGVWPGLALVGIPAGTTVHAGDAVAATAQSDTTTAYNYLAGLPCGTALTGLDLGGMTLAPGVYCFTSSAGLTGTLVLDGQGQANPLFVFQIATTLTTANVAVVTMIHNARPCGVYWQTGSSTTVGVASNFAGNIVALDSITLNTGASLTGRALARNGAVTMDTNSVNNATCPDFEPPSGTGLDGGPIDASMTDATDAQDIATDAQDVATDAMDASADGG